MCEIEPEESYEYYDAHHVKSARKDHVCLSCMGPIEKGESYKRVTYKIEQLDPMKTEKQCMACYELSTRFGKAHYGLTSTPDDLACTLATCIEEREEGWKGWLKELKTLQERNPEFWGR